MTKRFVIEDAFHCEWIGEFDSRSDAMRELRRLAELPWDSAPNAAPCMSWATCGREYHLIEFDSDTKPYWTELCRDYVLGVSAQGIEWISPFGPLTG